MKTICTVDADLFDSLGEAIKFVASCGGGIVYSDLAGSLFANGHKLPPGVRIERRPAAEAQQVVQG